jgi:hypothetical protein
MSYLKEGRKKEAMFARLFEDNFIRYSTTEEDMKEHWDVQLRFDVKGVKKVRRGDNETNQNYHYVEIKNVNGEKGWAYGDADYFAFEIDNYWIMVSKKDLQDFIRENVSKEYTPKPSLLKLYRRNGKKDVITLVESYDLWYISTLVVKKD